MPPLLQAPHSLYLYPPHVGLVCARVKQRVFVHVKARDASQRRTCRARLQFFPSSPKHVMKTTSVQSETAGSRGGYVRFSKHYYNRDLSHGENERSPRAGFCISQNEPGCVFPHSTPFWWREKGPRWQSKLGVPSANPHIHGNHLYRHLFHMTGQIQSCLLICLREACLGPNAKKINVIFGSTLQW